MELAGVVGLVPGSLAGAVAVVVELATELDLAAVKLQQHVLAAADELVVPSWKLVVFETAEGSFELAGPGYWHRPVALGNLLVVDAVAAASPSVAQS